MIAALWQLIGDPWDEPIMRRAFAEVALLAIAGGALSCWVVLYELSYSAESLAHSLLPGLVVASLIGVPLVIGGGAGLLVAAAAVALAGRTPAIGRDTAVAVVVTALFGLGVLLALSPQTPAGLEGLLLGDVLGVDDVDLALAGGLAVGLLGALRLLHRPLLIVGFDRRSAPALGVVPVRVDAALLGLLATATLAGVQGLGNLLVVAVLIVPASAVRGHASSVAMMLVLAVAVAVAAGVAGLYVSYYTGTAAGASIAAALLASYVVAGLVRVLARLTPSGSRRSARAG